MRTGRSLWRGPGGRSRTPGVRSCSFDSVTLTHTSVREQACSRTVRSCSFVISIFANTDPWCQIPLRASALGPVCQMHVSNPSWGVGCRLAQHCVKCVSKPRRPQPFTPPHYGNKGVRAPIKAAILTGKNCWRFAARASSNTSAQIAAHPLRFWVYRVPPTAQDAPEGLRTMIV